MYIAVAVDGNTLKDRISDKFASCKNLLIVDMRDLSFYTIKNDSTGEDLANQTIDYDCEATITGDLMPSEFDILADADITRFWAPGETAEVALDLMEKYELRIIRNHENSDRGCDE